MTQRITLITASIFGLLAVGLGAFGAHAFKTILTANGRLETYELASRYQFYHALALLLTGLLMDRYNLGMSAYFFVGGMIVFSGSLYILSLTGQTWWGAVTPIGGVLLILGWAMLAWGFYKGTHSA